MIKVPPFRLNLREHLDCWSPFDWFTPVLWMNAWKNSVFSPQVLSRRHHEAPTNVPANVQISV
jgi:hypothetical protein